MKITTRILPFLRRQTPPASPFVELGPVALLTGKDENGNGPDGGEVHGYQLKQSVNEASAGR
jgi:hypothetical protein